MTARVPAGLGPDALARHSFGRAELAGALGDIGVLFPLAAGLAVISGLQAGAVLLTTGAVYLASSLYFRLPVPVQPLKAMAAIAIAGGAGAQELAAGGIIMGLLMLLAGVTGLAGRLGRFFEPWTVRGVQLAVGLLLVKGSFKLVLGKDAWGGTALSPRVAGAALAVVLAVALLFLVLSERRRIAAALGVLAAGFAAGLIVNGDSLLGGLSLGPDLPGFSVPPMASFLTSLFVLVLPQLPVTFGNSVVATVDAAQSYYGPRSRRVTPRALCTSIGLSNLVLGLLGSMPVCHGSGGVTAHYRLGARTGGATAIMGFVLIVPALLLGDSALSLLLVFPLPVLGLFMVYVGLEHARLVGTLRGSPVALCVALTVGLVSLAFNNVALGLAVGILASIVIREPHIGGWARRFMEGQNPQACGEVIPALAGDGAATSNKKE